VITVVVLTERIQICIRDMGAVDSDSMFKCDAGRSNQYIGVGFDGCEQIVVLRIRTHFSIVSTATAHFVRVRLIYLAAQQGIDWRRTQGVHRNDLRG
jgi:hypothetical protein